MSSQAITIKTTITPTQSNILLFDLSPPDAGPLGGVGPADEGVGLLGGGVDTGGVCVGMGDGLCGFI